MSSPRDILIETIEITAESDLPKFQQLYQQIRAQIDQRVLLAGTRLPSTRMLARDLNVSRNTVTTAFEQLESEGYIETQRCSVARVANLPELLDDKGGLNPTR